MASPRMIQYWTGNTYLGNNNPGEVNKEFLCITTRFKNQDGWDGMRESCGFCMRQGLSIWPCASQLNDDVCHTAYELTTA